MKILSIDPSGSYNYGQGTTGWCLINSENHELLKYGNIKAKDYISKKLYHKAHIDLIRNIECDKLIIENFILFKGNRINLINKELETSELIGYITGVANEIGIDLIKQSPKAIQDFKKNPDIILEVMNKNIMQIEFISTPFDREQWYFKNKRISCHIVDAIKHYLFFETYKLEKLDYNRLNERLNISI